uniref:Immunoglobulin C1-set domain-containing protein n=2 Tax=Scophthalmus maximus TaxID=52904 RepID=A0A8D2ZK05_SCOMX
LCTSCPRGFSFCGLVEEDVAHPNLFGHILPGDNVIEIPDWPVRRCGRSRRTLVLSLRSDSFTSVSVSGPSGHTRFLIQLLANETSDPAMKAVLCLAALAVFVCSVESKYSPPKVQLYSRDPGENGKDNTLICHNWQFHLTKSVPFLPNDGQMYSCKVTHGSNVKDYAWESNM